MGISTDLHIKEDRTQAMGQFLEFQGTQKFHRLLEHEMGDNQSPVVGTRNFLSPAARGSGTRGSGTNAKFSKSSRAW